VRARGDDWLLANSLLIQSNWSQQYGLDGASLQEALRLCAKLGVIHERGLALSLLGRHAYLDRRPFAEVKRYFEEGRRVFAQLAEFTPMPGAASFLVGYYLQQGAIEPAFADLHEEQRLLERLGNTRLLARSLHWESLHASRYSTFEHALEVRQRSLQLAQKLNIHSDVAWQEFELGEIHRIFGDPEQAHTHYARARAGFERMNYVLGLGYCERAEGDLAWSNGRCVEALARYEAYLSRAAQDNHLWSIAHAHAKLGLAHAGLDDVASARRETQAALAIMRDWQENDLALLALLAESLCLAHEGQAARAIELAAFIAHHPVSWNETKQQARAILETATRGLPAPEAQAAIERGQALNLESVVQPLLA
jgi:hypothetical protein